MRSAPLDAPDPATLLPEGGQPWARYRNHLARHLIEISRDLQTRVRETLRDECGYASLRPSFAPFLSMIWDEGRPVSAIADELGISKQACSQLANRVEAAGYLERKAHPEDGRSKLVMLTPRGRALVEDAVRIILETENAYEAMLGKASYRRFVSALPPLFEGLGIRSHSDPTLTERAHESAGLLPLISDRVEREILQGIVAKGHRGLKASHGEVLSRIGPGGARVHELARIQRVSRQAVSAISRELEGLGYLRRDPDPLDRRGVILTLTRKGFALIKDSVAVVDALEAKCQGFLGKKAFRDLELASNELFHALHIEAELIDSSESQPGAGPTPSHLDIHRLAAQLRRQLGSGDSARLAALLEPQTRKTAS